MTELLSIGNSYPAGRPFSDTFTVLECASCYAYRGIFFFLHCVSLIKLLRHARAGGLLVLAILTWSISCYELVA